MNARRTAWTAGILALAGLTPGCPTPNDDNGGGGGGSDSGSFVAEFGSGVEVAVSNPSGGNDEAVAVAMDAPYFYVAGTKRGTGTSSEVYWRIEKRAIENGSLQASAESNPSAGIDEPRAIAYRANDVYVAGTEGNAWRVEKRAQADLAFVAAFGTGGSVTGAPGTPGTAPAAMAVDESHMYLVGTDGAVWRIEKRSLDTGALESTTFGGGTGVILSDPSGSLDEAFAIDIDADYMYVAGTQGEAWRVEKRSLSTGELEATTFGGATGAITSDPGVSQDRATAIAVSGSLLFVAGYETVGLGDRRWRVEKRDPATGDLEATTFGAGTGAVDSDPGTGFDEPTDLILDYGIDEEFFFVAGFDTSGTSPRWRIEKRSTSTGLLEAAFGAGGVATVDPSESDDRILAVEITLGRLIAVGYDSVPGDREWRMQGFDRTDGTLAPFGEVGYLEVHNSVGVSRPLAIALDSTHMYVVGEVDANGPSAVSRIEKRRLSDGGLATWAQTSLHPFDRIRVEGGYVYALKSEAPWKLWKLRSSDLSQVLEFGGVGTGFLPGDSDVAFPGIDLDDSFIFLCGNDSSTGVPLLRLEKRDITTGSLESGFGVGGVVTGPNTLTYATVVESPYLYFAGWNSDGQRVERRFGSNGVPSVEFGTGGGVSDDPVSGNLRPKSMAFNATHMFVAGNPDIAPSTLIVLQRNIENGALVPVFGNAGVATSVSFDAEPLAAGWFALDGDSYYLAGGAAGAWRVEKHNSRNGHLSPHFGDEGVATSDPSEYDDQALAVAVDEEHLYVVGSVGTAGYGGYSRWRIEKRRK